MAAVGRTVVWCAVVGTLVVLTLVPRVHERLTTYSTASPRLATAEVVATVALLAACVVGLVLQPARPGLVALALAAPAWTLADWAGWYAGPDVMRSLGLVLMPFLVPLLVHAVLAGAGLHVLMRGALVGLYVAAGSVALVRAMAHDPFFDEACWSTCSVDNVFLVSPRPDLVEWRRGRLAVRDGARGSSPSWRSRSAGSPRRRPPLGGCAARPSSQRWCSVACC